MSICRAPRRADWGNKQGCVIFPSPERKKRKPPGGREAPPGTSNFALAPWRGGALRGATRRWGPGERKAWTQSAEGNAAGKGPLGEAMRAGSSAGVGSALPDLWPSLDLWASKLLSGEDALVLTGFPGWVSTCGAIGLEESVGHTSPAHLSPWRVR